VARVRALPAPRQFPASRGRRVDRPAAGPRRVTLAKRRGPYALLALGSGAGFVAITLLYRAGATRGIDNELRLRLLGVHAGWLDALGAADELLFRPTPTLAAAAVLAVLLWRFGPRWSWGAPLAIGLAVVAEVIVKNGPSQVLHLRSFIDGVLVLFGGHYHAPASFPSGHVIRAMFLAIVALAFLPRIVSIPIAALALSTPLARMYTEAHRLSDVLGGASLGICVACAAVCGVALLGWLESHLRVRWRIVDAGFARKMGAWR
jgi:membrane-associated phospholipid phosphatase